MRLLYLILLYACTLLIFTVYLRNNYSRFSYQKGDVLDIYVPVLLGLSYTLFLAAHFFIKKIGVFLIIISPVISFVIAIFIGLIAGFILFDLLQIPGNDRNLMLLCSAIYAAINILSIIFLIKRKGNPLLKGN